MDAAVSDLWLDRFGEFVATHLGLDFPENRRRDLARGLLAVSHEFGFDDMQACVRWLTATEPSRPRIEVLARHLAVGETYFFREMRLFEALERQILPELIASREGAERRLRLWSAGCSTGEELYSLAILLTRLPFDRSGWNITLLGTDIDAKALHKAQEGVYGEWSFRDAPGWLKEHYVRQRQDSRYEVLPQLKQAVTFGYLNLAEQSYPSVANKPNAMDVILCCNVLMYFTPKTRAQVVERFYRTLVDGGWLLVSCTEAIPALFPRFEPLRVGDALLFRRPQADISIAAPETPALPPPAIPVAETPSPPPPARSPRRAAAPAPRPSPYDEALALYERGSYQEAVEMLRPLHEPRAYVLLARAYANQGSLEEALGWCEKAIVADKVDPLHHYLHASILSELDRRAEAVAALKRALYLDPELIVAHMALAHLLNRRGKREAAERQFRQALALLQGYARDAEIPHAEGLTAGRLRETIYAMWPEGAP